MGFVIQSGGRMSVDGFLLLAKPYRVEELATKIRTVLEQSDA